MGKALLLQRLTAVLPKEAIETELGPMRSFEESIDESRRSAAAGFLLKSLRRPEPGPKGK